MTPPTERASLPPPPVPAWWRWLSSPSLNQHAFRYAALLVGLNGLAWLIVGVSGGDMLDRRLPVVLFPVAGFVIWTALAFYRRRRDTEMGFGRGLKLGALISVSSTIGLALLLGGLMAGSSTLRQRHFTATLQMLASQRTSLETLPNGRATYTQQVAGAGTTTALDITLDEIPRRLVPALLLALLGAILFRKANPEGTEPEKAPRPAKESKNG